MLRVQLALYADSAQLLWCPVTVVDLGRELRWHGPKLLRYNALCLPDDH